MKTFQIADLHCDTAMRLLKGHRLDQGKGHVTLERLRSGGVVLQVFACWISPAYRRLRAAQHARRLIEAVRDEVFRRPQDLQLVYDRKTWASCRRSGRIGILLGIEGGHGLGDDLRNLEVFRDLGLRMLTLTWNNSNIFACSAWRAQKSGKDTGLTPLGRELVAEANRLDIVLDLSHSSRKTFWDVIKISKKPAVVSHSCVSFLQPHFRNLDDDQLRALASAGWVLGINFYPGFLGGVEGRCDLARVAEHFAYVRELVGPDCLAMGSDFDGVGKLPDGLEGPHRFPDLLSAIRARGFTDRELRKVASGNFLRLLGWSI